MKYTKIDDYQRIEKAIEFICANAEKQPSLKEVAKQVHLSPFHFQRMFKKWTGSTPKKFLQYISLQNAKNILKDSYCSIFEAADKIGMSGTSRLHDLFVSIEGMTPGDFKNGGKNLTIRYTLVHTNFGNTLIASTSKGICQVLFFEHTENAINSLRNEFPNANLINEQDKSHESVLFVLNNDLTTLKNIKLHIKGTKFQIKVWEALLKIPEGKITSYGQVAKYIGSKNSSRAVGSAIGKNPVAILIPCHRVIQSTGIIGEYKWGKARKKAILAKENST